MIFFLIAKAKTFANTITNRQFRIFESKMCETITYDQNLLMKLVTDNIILTITYQSGYAN